MPPIRGKRAAAHSPSVSGPRPNSIGAHSHELGPLLDRLDRAAADPTVLAQRVHSRWPFRHTAVKIVFEHPGGTTAECTVACRNLSCGGAALLHGAFTHTGTRCTAHLARLDGKVREVVGAVVRCIHVKGLVHELGVRFDEPITLREHVSLDLLQGRSSYERVEPSDLVGSLLCVLPDDIEQRMLQHFTAETHVSLRIVESFEHLRDAEDFACDAVLIDVQSVPVEEAVRALGRASPGLPVITVGVRCPPDLSRLLGPERIITFVRKPMVQEGVLAALAECLISVEGGAPRAAARSISAAVLRQAEGRIARRADDLRLRLAADDPMGCYSICQELRTIAEQIGAAATARAADNATTRLASTMSTTESLQEIGELIRVCEAADAQRRSA